MEKKVAVVIINWNGKDDTVRCLTSVKKVNRRNYELEVWVVDNGSTNDSVAVIKKAHPWVKLITTGKNLGFTGGNNLGIQAALAKGAGYFWLLNNDTLVEQNVLCALDNFSHPQIGLVGSKIYFAAGHEYHRARYRESQRGKVFWYAGGLIDWKNMYASHRGVDEVDHGQYNQKEETPFISGCSLFVSRRVLQNIGLLDDRFFLYYEDLDLCLRAKRAGYKLLYDPHSLVWHVNAGSSGGAGNPLHDYYLTRNRILIGYRYASLRTKIALARESLHLVWKGPTVKRKAVLDAAFGRWGNRYEPRKFTN